MARRGPAEIEARIARLRDRLMDRGAPSLVPGKVVGSEDAIVERVRPFGVVMYLVMTASAGAHESERTALRGAMRILTDGRMNGASVDAFVAEVERAVAEQGRGPYLERTANALLGSIEDSELALALAGAMAAADKELDPAERAELVELAELLGIPVKRRAALIG